MKYCCPLGEIINLDDRLIFHSVGLLNLIIIFSTHSALSNMAVYTAYRITEMGNLIYFVRNFNVQLNRNLRNLNVGLKQFNCNSSLNLIHPVCWHKIQNKELTTYVITETNSKRISTNWSCLHLSQAFPLMP